MNGVAVLYSLLRGRMQASQSHFEEQQQVPPFFLATATIPPPEFKRSCEQFPPPLPPLCGGKRSEGGMEQHLGRTCNYSPAPKQVPRSFPPFSSSFSRSLNGHLTGMNGEDDEEEEGAVKKRRGVS